MSTLGYIVYGVVLAIAAFTYARSTGTLGGNGAWPWDKDRWPR